MTNREAKAVCSLIHMLMKDDKYAFYAFTAAIGHDLSGTSELGSVAHEKDNHVTPKAIAFFKAVAEGLEKGDVDETQRPLF